MKIKKKLAILFLVMIVASNVIFSSCSFFDLLKSDEEKIKACIEDFEKCYNDGDLDGVVDCLAKKERKKLQAELNLLSALMGGLTGFELSLSDLFSLGVGMQDSDMIRIDVDEVRFTDTTTATAEGVVYLWEGTEMEESPTWFYMVKEDNGWFIQDMVDPPEEENSESFSSEK